MTESINQLIMLCTQQAPGQKECDNALRELEVSALEDFRGWEHSALVSVGLSLFGDCLSSVFAFSLSQEAGRS